MPQPLSDNNYWVNLRREYRPDILKARIFYFSECRTSVFGKNGVPRQMENRVFEGQQKKESPETFNHPAWLS
jgi:hypothetical protein